MFRVCAVWFNYYIWEKIELIRCKFKGKLLLVCTTTINFVFPITIAYKYICSFVGVILQICRRYNIFVFDLYYTWITILFIFNFQWDLKSHDFSTLLLGNSRLMVMRLLTQRHLSDLRLITCHSSLGLL